MNRYSSFDGLRGYAAIGILLMHYLANIDSSVSGELKNDFPLLYGSIIPFFTTFVYMFFIVSAFSMCCGYYKKFATTKVYAVEGDPIEVCSFNTEKFYSRRYSRIWPFFALLVLIDVIMKPSITEVYQAFADLTLAFNLLPNPDINVIGVGWFLGLVFLFYMIFPWFAFLLQTKKRAWFAMMVALIFHVILVRYFLTSEFCTASQIGNARHNIVFSFPFFMSGGLLYLYKDRLTFKKLSSRVVLLCICILATILQFTPWAPNPLGENILWIGVIFVLWVVYGMSGGIFIKGFKFLDNKVAKFLGDLSMEIYLCHMVMFRVVEKLHLEKLIHNEHVLYWTTCIVGLILAIIFSYVVTKIIFPKISGAFGKKVEMT